MLVLVLPTINSAVLGMEYGVATQDGGQGTAAGAAGAASSTNSGRHLIISMCCHEYWLNFF
jgi:hypothetical protein